MNYSAAFTSVVNEQAKGHLLREDGQEDLCFALWNPSTGKNRKTALIEKLILPEEGERTVHGNAAFLPTYFERAIGIAIEAEMGLAFMHSHPGSGWQDMSRNDIKAEQNNAAAVKSATGLPFVGMTLGADGSWSVRFWEKIGPGSYERRWCEGVRVVGECGLQMTFADHILPPPHFRERLKRTVSAWGKKKQANVARLTIGVVGVGSVGSIIAESLARMGVVNIKLIDFDVVEEVNLDRLLNVTEKDIGKPKVNVIARALSKSATAEKVNVETTSSSIVETDGFLVALDCDILFSCVDRPWPRSVLNLIAYSHLIPVVDGGISIQTKRNGDLQGADWKTHIAMPSRRCLECIGQYDPSDIQLEREGYIDDHSYIQTLDTDHHLRRNENVFCFSSSLASAQVLQMISLIVAPLGISDPGEFFYHFVTGQTEPDQQKICNPNCIYQKIIATGDTCPYHVTGKHDRAEAVRASYATWWTPIFEIYHKIKM